MAPSTTPSWVKKLTPSGPQGHELLSGERAKSLLDTKRISEFLWTKEELTRKDRVLEQLQAEKVFEKSQNYTAGRRDRFEMSLARAKKLVQLKRKFKWDDGDYYIANELLSESTPYRLHDSMFLVSKISPPTHFHMLLACDGDRHGVPHALINMY